MYQQAYRSKVKPNGRVHFAAFLDLLVCTYLCMLFFGCGPQYLHKGKLVYRVDPASGDMKIAHAASSLPNDQATMQPVSSSTNYSPVSPAPSQTHDNLPVNNTKSTRSELTEGSSISNAPIGNPNVADMHTAATSTVVPDSNLLTEANQAITEGKYSDAGAIASAILKNQPDSVEALFILASSCKQKYDNDTKIKKALDKQNLILWRSTLIHLRNLGDHRSYSTDTTKIINDSIEFTNRLINTSSLINYTIHIHGVPPGVDGVKVSLEGGEMRWYPSYNVVVSVTGAAIGHHWCLIIIPKRRFRCDYNLKQNGQQININIP